MHSQFEADLVHKGAAVPAACLEVLELPPNDGVVIGDQVINVTGLVG